MQNNEKDELLLASSIAAGDENAIEEYYNRHADSLYAFIFHHVNREDAEEIWQDCLLVSIRNIANFRGQSSMFTWLCAIARHKIADYYRKQNRTAAFVDTPVEEINHIFDDAPLPEETLQQKSVRLKVIEALHSLPDEYRNAIIARYADNNSVDEIAEQLGKSYKATESLLSRARSAFRKAFIPE